MSTLRLPGIRHVAVVVAAAALWLPPAGSAQARIAVMHGFAEYTSVTLWLQAERAGPVEIEVAPEAGGEAHRVSLVADAALDCVSAARVPGLAPGTPYRYRIAAQGETWEGVVRTQRYWSSARDAAERENPDAVPGALHGRRQFGLIRFSGPGGDRRIALEAYDSDGAALRRHDIRANDLRFARGKP